MSETTSTTTELGGKLLVVVLLVCVYGMVLPFLSLWALNLLFHLDIPYRWDTFLAAMVLRGMMVGVPSHSNRRTETNG